MMITSLFKLSSIGKIEGLTLEHFREVLSPVYFSVIGNSISLALGASLCSSSLFGPISFFTYVLGTLFWNVKGY